MPRLEAKNVLGALAIASLSIGVALKTDFATGLIVLGCTLLLTLLILNMEE